MRLGAWLAVLVVAALALPAPAAARLVVGIGDQKPAMFDDPRFRWLGLRHARLVVPWHVAGGRGRAAERAHIDAWLRRARATGVQPVVGFGHGYEGRWRDALPSVRQYRAAVRRFRRTYPWVRAFITWNEANHCSQPTCKRPERAAAYFDALQADCRRCTVLAPAVLDQGDVVRWVRAFRRAARRKPRVWALHNYLDVNRLRSTGTRRFLRALPRRARVWVVETGGVVARAHYRGKASFPENPVRAGRVTTFALRLAARHRQIERIYLYHWNIHRLDVNWDSGLIDHLGRPRPGFAALARFLRRDPRQAPEPQQPPPQPPPPQEQQPPPPSGGEPPPQEPPPPPPQEPPPPCTLPVCVGDPALGGG